MSRSHDPLTQLLRQALYQQKQQVQIIKQSPPPEPLGIYNNPLNWTRSRTLALIHVSPDGRETFLGVFTELKNERAKVRRLVRDHSPKPHGPALPREVVSGPYWLRPQVRETPTDSEAEEKAIRDRFAELMKEFG